MSETPPEPPVELGILSLTKKALNIAPENTSFDSELVMFINGVLADLTQLGIGPSSGFEIEDDTAKWSDMLGFDKRFNAAKSYTATRVRLAFDPPEQYFVVQAMKEQIQKDEWRLNVAREDAKNAPPELPDNTVNLVMTAGLPYSRRIRVAGAAATWPTLASFEVRSQIRLEQSSTSRLLGTLTPYITATIDGLDIVLDLNLTGADTRQIPSGYYDIVISDVGPTDARAIPVLAGRVMVPTTVTAASDG